ncbi:hypothetical protein Tco_0823398 [Tanacetum coccineum]|uniref:Hyaluronan/mRNA-binding protein domain-containing protein n=1 Tax=Tanacetum coccineum TaxID=301880 RepID=A0ABQ5AMS3_9ASTR
MPDKPQKNKIKAPDETNGSQKQVFVGQCASRGGGRSGRGDGNDGSGSGVNNGSGSGVNDYSGSGVNDGSGSGRRGGDRAGGRGKRGGGRASRGSGRGSRGGVFPSSSSTSILTDKEVYEQAFRECMEEQAITQAKIDVKQEKTDKEKREEQEWEEKNDYINPANEEFIEEAPMNQQYHGVLIPSIHSQPTQQSGVWVMDTTVTTADVEEAPAVETSDTSTCVKEAPAVDKGKAKATVEDEPALTKKRGRPPSSVDGIRIYHKNRGRSERIANMKLNKPF